MCVCLFVCVFVCLSLYLCECLSLCVCVKVLKEELKIGICSVKNLNVNEFDIILKHINISNTKRIHCTVYLNAYCAWGKVKNVKIF